MIVISKQLSVNAHEAKTNEIEYSTQTASRHMHMLSRSTSLFLDHALQQSFECNLEKDDRIFVNRS